MELVLIRGLPGSGKSTIARSMNFDVHYEADMFFINKNGDYCYDPRKIGEAHKWCQEGVYQALLKGKKVVVSNTFIKLFEMKPYFDMAHELGVELDVIQAEGRWSNVHDVPEEVVKRMEDNWEDLK